MAKISVIIVSYNTCELTLQCLTSLFKIPDAKIDKEVIVVDNGSTDGSPNQIQKKFSQVNFIPNAQNRGFAQANNQGIRASTGDFILLLNSDAEIIEPDTLTRLIAAHDQHAASASPDCLIVPRLLNSDHTDQASVFNLPTISNAIRQYWFNQSGAYEKYLPSSSRPVRVEAAVMAAMLIPRSVLNVVGLLDESYFMYYEDLEFCRRVRQRGFSIIYIPDIQIMHHHGASGKSVAKAADQWKRLIPSSKRYHGLIIHQLLFCILWLGQKKNKLIPT